MKMTIVSALLFAAIQMNLAMARASQANDRTVQQLYRQLHQVLKECKCPPSCIFRLGVCLRVGTCSACTISTYGRRKRSAQDLVNSGVRTTSEQTGFLKMIAS